MNQPVLSRGRIHSVYHDSYTSPIIVQILNVLLLKNGDRYRCEISDGVNKIGGVFSLQFNQQLSNNEIHNFCVISLNKYNITPVKTGCYLVIAQLQILQSDINTMIGNPVSIETVPAIPSQLSQNPIPRPPNLPPSQQNPSNIQPQISTNNNNSNFNNNNNNNNSVGNTFNNSNINNNNNTNSNSYVNKPQNVNYSGQNQPIQQQQQQQYQNRPNYTPNQIQVSPPNMPNSTNYVPIKSLNIYNNNWTIKARVSKTYEKRVIANKKNPTANPTTTIFSIDLVDQDGTKIKGTFFNQEAEQYSNFIQEKQVYSISGGTIKIADKRYSSLPGPHEITFNSRTSIQQLSDDMSIKSDIYNFSQISEIVHFPKDKIIDVIGIIHQSFQAVPLNTKKGPMNKKDMEIVDSSGYSVRLTLFGAPDKFFEEYTEGSIISATGCRVSEYSGKSLGLGFDGVININPRLEQAEQLRNWYDGKGRETMFTSLSTGMEDKLETRKFVSDFSNEKLSNRLGDSAAYDSIKASIIRIPIQNNKDIWYPACTNTIVTDQKSRTCNKKLIPNGEQNYFTCNFCNKVYETPTYRYMASLTVADHTGCTYLSIFDEVAANHFGKTADQMNLMKVSGDLEDFLESFRFKEHLFRVRVTKSLDDSNPEKGSVIRYHKSASKIVSIDYINEGKKLAEAIQSMMSGLM